MTLKMNFTEDIAAPREDVWRAMTDLDRCGEWMQNFVRIEKLTSGPFAAGTRWKEYRRMFGREAFEVFEVKNAQSPTLLELYVDGKEGASKRGWYRFIYRLESQGRSTRLFLDGEIGGMGRIGTFFCKLFSGPFKKAIAKDLLCMKKWIEKNAA